MEMYSEFIMRAVRQYLGYDAKDTSVDVEILQMSRYKVLNSYLAWIGIAGYTSDILQVIDDYEEIHK